MGNCVDKQSQSNAVSENSSKKESKENSLQSKPSQENSNQKVISELKDFTFSTNDFVSKKKTNIFDEYSILGASLGTGSYGEVHKGVHKLTNIMRAIKFISKDLTTAEERERLYNEVQILKSLDHPNIIKVLECYEDESRLYIVTELCTGGELFDKIKANKYMTEKESACIMQQILSAVMYCHKNNIVHRDLKPENVLYESTKPNSALKVIDFGTSREFKPNQKLSQKFGTPFYVAPEILTGKYDEKCDLWSCGVILYILLSGVPPFYGPNEIGILEQVKKGVYSLDLPEFEEVTEEAKNLIKKLLTLNTTERLSAEEALQHPWFKIMNSNETVEKPLAAKTLDNLAKFSTSQKIQQGLFIFMVSTMLTKEEKSALTDVFKSLDVNGDGRLSYEELVEGYSKIFNDRQMAKEKVDQIMVQIDANKSGAIDYSEFITASVNKQQLLTKQRIEQLFNWIDKDGSKKISFQELRNLLGSGKDEKVTDQVWKEMIKEIDINGDGEISFEEFKEIMLKLLV